MMKPKPIVNGWFVISMVLFIAGGLWATIQLEAFSDDRYISIGRQPFQFVWHNELPFEVLEPLCWNQEAGFCDIEGNPFMFVSIVDTEDKIVYELYITENGMFALGFSEARGADGHPHPIELASWIMMNREP